MAIFQSCCCCSLFIGGLICGFFAIIVYLAAFVVEVWWIIHNAGQLPIPEFVLMGAYFIVFLASLFMLSGVAAKKTSFLLLWLVVMVIVFAPECGMVLYLFINDVDQHKRDPRALGVLIFYICRAVLNVFSILIIYSLYSKWREDKKVLQRLDNLTLVYTPSKMERNTTGHKYEVHDNAAFNDHNKHHIYGYNHMREPTVVQINKGCTPNDVSHVRQSEHYPEMIEHQSHCENPAHYNHQTSHWPDKKWESMGAIHLAYLENNHLDPYEKHIWNENRYNLQNESYDDSKDFQYYVPRSLRNLNEANFFIENRPASICTPRMLYEHSYKMSLPPHPSSLGLQRKAKSVDALTKLEFDDAVTLEPLQRKPFDYLHRSGMLPTDFEDNKNVKDIAL